MSPTVEFQSPKQLIKATDEQLYLAKQQGRNCFVMQGSAQGSAEV